MYVSNRFIKHLVFYTFRYDRLKLEKQKDKGCRCGENRVSSTSGNCKNCRCAKSGLSCTEYPKCSCTICQNPFGAKATAGTGEKRKRQETKRSKNKKSAGKLKRLSSEEFFKANLIPMRQSSWKCEESLLLNFCIRHIVDVKRGCQFTKELFNTYNCFVSLNKPQNCRPKTHTQILFKWKHLKKHNCIYNRTIKK